MKKLLEPERQTLLNYLSAEPDFNLFMIGDLENYGMNSADVEFYAGMGKAGLDVVLMRYMNNYTLYSHHEDYHIQAVADWLDGRSFETFNGKEALLRPLLHGYSGGIRRMYLSRLDTVKQTVALPEGIALRRLQPEDAECVLDFYLQISDFLKRYEGHAKEDNLYKIAENLRNGGRIYGAFCYGRLVSTAGTSAENSMSAMVIGVGTLPELRGKGCASALVAALCKSLLDEGKRFVCLLYDNPSAGRIYRRVGFQEMGGWTMVERGAFHANGLS